jgi:hypothetical protein
MAKSAGCCVRFVIQFSNVNFAWQISYSSTQAMRVGTASSPRRQELSVVAWMLDSIARDTPAPFIQRGSLMGAMVYCNTLGLGSTLDGRERYKACRRSCLHVNCIIRQSRYSVA